MVSSKARTVGRNCMKKMLSFHRHKPVFHELGSERVSGTSERMSATERASSVEQAYE